MRTAKQSANNRIMVLFGQIVFVLCVFVTGQFALVQNVSADMKDDCLYNSGGREAIESVQWACDVWAKGYGETNVCSLWLGGDSSVDPTIYVDSVNEYKTVHYYGMCTDRPNTTAKIWVENDNNSIDSSVNLRRGYWGSPTFVNTTLNVANFIDGSLKTTSSEGDVYTRYVEVCRRNGSASSCSSYPGACSCMNEEIKVVVKNYDYYYGRVAVSSSDEALNNGEGAVLGFTQEDGKATYYINDCDPVNGCSAKFWHYLKREGGDGATTYNISRISNYSSVSNEVSVKNAVELFDSANPVEVYEETFVNKLKPGQVVCEKLTFAINRDGDERNLTVCASALGNAQPSDPEPDSPSGDQAYLNIKVKNNNVEKYNSYQRTIYAKPGDTLSYRSTYNPVLQYAYNIVPERIRIDDGEILPLSGRNSNKLGDLYNEVAVSTSWKNAYVVNGGFSSSFGKKYQYGAGDTQTRTNVDEYKVTSTNVGQSLDGNAQTNSVADIKITPRQVAFEKQTVGGASYNVAHVITGALSSTAYAKVPYNFRTAISVNSGNEVIGAGESGVVNIPVDVLTKTNSETTSGSNDEAYATIVRGANIKMVVYVPGSGTTKSGTINYGTGGSSICERYSSASLCNEKTIANNTLLNSDGNLAGKTGDGVKSVSFNVPDLDAGAEVCVAAAVYPSNSGSDTNLDKKGNDQWNVSDSKCFTIAKKPSIQVWGAGIFSNGDIGLLTSRKNNINGYTEYSINSSGKSFIFGSWTELEVVALGAVTGLSSGASTGYANIDNANLWPNYNSDNTPNTELLTAYGPGGSYEAGSNYCLRSVLTFANESCSRSVAGSIGNVSEGSNLENSKKNLIERFRSNKDKDDIIYENRVNYAITESIVVDKGMTRIIDVEGSDVTIDHDIDYLSGQMYSKREEIPKLIIYANNIKINCNVTRIDAVLIAENNINTCYNSDNIDNRINSNQLIINGSVITDTLFANRTYGAAKGANSIVPAEIVNYDTTLYLWGNNQASTANTGRLMPTYLHDVPPRY
ncbi:hypothetical protein IKG49_01365 [Candidatus Saccharibacteria bacterium]|nr:hypothetical protein [Candidatus Saccharibacteria bacterium]